jgi:CO/xanthine dehydrogenase FAD-binding subunit
MDYCRPRTLDDALRVLAAAGTPSTVIAGGTDLLVDIKFRGFQPAGLVNINALDDLRYVREGPDGGILIGALTHVQALALDPLIAERAAAIADAARTFASRQVRNLATIGGSLGRATPAGDLLPPLLVLDATAVLRSAAAGREVPLAEFFLGPRRTVLGPGELITEIRIPAAAPGSGSSYARMSYRDVLDLAIVGVASSLTLDAGGRVAGARVALGAVAPRPIRAPRTEALLEGRPITDELIAEAGAIAASEATPISDQRASAEYRTLMTAVLTRRSLRAAAAAAAARGSGATAPPAGEHHDGGNGR